MAANGCLCGIFRMVNGGTANRPRRTRRAPGVPVGDLGAEIVPQEGPLEDGNSPPARCVGEGLVTQLEAQ